MAIGTRRASGSAVLLALSLALTGTAAAQGVEGVRAGGEAIVGSPCPEATAPPAAAGRDTAARSDSAQRPGQRPASAGRVAVALLASASAEEVRFAKQPTIRVRLCGGLDSIRVVERRNLPSPVVAGQTYRNVYVAVEILARLDGECLVERLGLRDSTPARTATRGACASISIDGIQGTPPPGAGP